MRTTAHIVVLWCLTSMVYGQVPPTKEGDHSGIEMDSDVDRKLLAFCCGAMLYDRGLTCTPFAGNTDKWVLEGLVPRQEFLAALDTVPLPSSLQEATLVGDRLTKEARSDILDTYQRRDRHTDKLLDALVLEQKKRLPLIYLYTEGLIALCRPQFDTIISKHAQDSIRKLANEAWSNEASMIHRSIFGLQSLDEAPVLQLQLRRIAYRLDCRIVGVLSEGERKALAEAISGTDRIRRVVHGAPAY